MSRKLFSFVAVVFVSAAAGWWLLTQAGLVFPARAALRDMAVIYAGCVMIGLAVSVLHPSGSWRACLSAVSVFALIPAVSLGVIVWLVRDQVVAVDALGLVLIGGGTAAMLVSAGQLLRIITHRDAIYGAVLCSGWAAVSMILIGDDLLLSLASSF